MEGCSLVMTVLHQSTKDLIITHQLSKSVEVKTLHKHYNQEKKIQITNKIFTFFL